MTDKPAPKGRRSIASFAGDDEIPPPTPQQLAEARSAGEGLGFRSEKPALATAPRAAARAREANFSNAIHVRARPEDRERFEEFAWRNRLKKGDAMKLVLDYAEAEERRRTEENG